MKKKYLSLKTVLLLSANVLLVSLAIGCNTQNSNTVVPKESDKVPVTSPTNTSETKTTISPSKTTSESKKEEIDSTKTTDVQVMDAEKYIIEQLNKKDNSKETRTKIFNALPSVDWKKYSQIHKNTDAELIEWLGKQDNLQEAEIKGILSGMKNLDGAYAEGYADILTKILANSPDRFVKALANFQLPKTDEVCNTMFSGVLVLKQDVKDSIKSKLQQMNIDSNTTPTDKDIISKLIETLSRKIQ